MLCELIEQVCIWTSIPEWLYRLLMIRYTMLIWLGWQWAKRGIELNSKTITLSIISIIALIWLRYGTDNPEPWFFDTGWKTHHWICFFLPASLLAAILHKAYKASGKAVKQLMCQMGKYSYEIYLWQMLVFAFYPRGIMTALIGNGKVATIVFMTATTLGSIIPILIYKKYKTHINGNKGTDK